MAGLQDIELYGGAIKVQLPSNFADVSDIRQVPDHQEVWLDRNSFTSVIFDILEYVEPETAANDEDALKYHFNDMVNGSGDTTQYVMAAEARLEKMPATPAYTLAATQTSSTSGASDIQAANLPKPKRPQPDFTGILLMLLRLPKQKTDIVVTINVPHVPGEYVKEDVNLREQKLGPLMTKAVEIRSKVLETFEIKDWSLFVN